MIKVYEKGNELVEENRTLLMTNQYMSVFFFLDGKPLEHTDKINYALKCQNEYGVLLAMEVRPYSLLLFGEGKCCQELFDWMIENEYQFDSYLCGKQTGDEVTEYLNGRYDYHFSECLAMDFMEAVEITEPSDKEVVHAVKEDIDDIYECMLNFVIDCNLTDEIDRNRIMDEIESYRVIHRDCHVVSVARLSPSGEKDMKITNVYTRNQYRGQSLARKVVNSLKNEIIESGRIATLNVDRNNPVTNHLYRALGFRPLFSQGQYRQE